MESREPGAENRDCFAWFSIKCEISTKSVISTAGRNLSPRGMRRFRNCLSLVFVGEKGQFGVLMKSNWERIAALRAMNLMKSGSRNGSLQPIQLNLNSFLILDLIPDYSSPKLSQI